MDGIVRPQQIAISSVLHRPLVLLAIQAVAFWAVWQWAISRFASSVEVGWEFLPLIAIGFLCWNTGSSTRTDLDRRALLTASALIGVYAAAFLFVPSLVRAILAFASITVVVSSWRFGRIFHPGIFGLFLLSLPIVESLNFFLGYPMRVVVGEAVVFLLNLQGIDVYREGVGLHFNETLIWIDAPCSGIKMLWFGTFLTIVLSIFLKFDLLRLAIVGFLGLLAVISGNVLRASALFYIESGLIEAPEWMHSAVGVASFALTSIFIVLLVGKAAEVKWLK